MTAVRYVLRAMRWQAIAVGAALGGALITMSHLSDLGPFASVHLGVGFGVIGIAVGAAFVLDDPAATTLQAVPTSVRRRALLRMALAGGIAGLALAGFAVAAWESLAYLDVVGQTAGLGALGIACAAVAGRLAGWQRPGIAGAAGVAAVVIADTVGLLPSERALLTGGAAVARDAAADWTWVATAAIVTVGMLWATRDPASGRRQEEPG